MKKSFTCSLLLLTLISCDPNKEDQMEIWKKEIVQVEKEFTEMAASEGIPKAFEVFAADEAVLMRNQKLIIGKKPFSNYITQLQFQMPSSTGSLNLLK